MSVREAVKEKIFLKSKEGTKKKELNSFHMMKITHDLISNPFFRENLRLLHFFIPENGTQM
jgi:hypothetical protein